MNLSDKQLIRRTAIDWVIKQQLDTFGPAQQRELEQWLRLDPAHGMALAEAERAWEVSAELPPLLTAEIPRPPRQRWRPSWHWLPGARLAQALACLVLLGGLALGWQPAWLHISADHYTAKGEIREIQLHDGSSVMLSGRTAIAVEYNQQERHVRLLRGEALFSPVPQNAQEPRPFVVEAAGGTNRALGTVFLLKREDADHGLLSVLEHSVLISLPEYQPQGEPRRQVLHEGQSVRYHRTGDIEKLAQPASSAASWTKGLLSYDDTPLGGVIDDLNNFSRERIILLDKHAAGQPVTAAFHLDSLDKALQLLSEQHQLRIAHLPGGIKLVY